MKNYALIAGDTVKNIALVDDESAGGQAYLVAIANDFDAVIEATEGTTIGQRIVDGQFIPLPTLIAEPIAIPSDGITFSVVTYTNLEPGAPNSIDFTVNESAPSPVELTEGIAALAVTSQTPGDTITIAAGGLSVQVQVTS